MLLPANLSLADLMSLPSAVTIVPLKASLMARWQLATASGRGDLPAMRFACIVTQPPLIIPKPYMEI